MRLTRTFAGPREAYDPMGFFYDPYTQLSGMDPPGPLIRHPYFGMHLRPADRYTLIQRQGPPRR